MPNDIQGGADATANASQAPATHLAPSAATNHEAFVAVLILTGFVLLLTVIADQSKTAGNTIIAFLVLIGLVQGITHVNPFVAWLAAHPLTPVQAQTQKGQ